MSLQYESGGGVEWWCMQSATGAVGPQQHCAGKIGGGLLMQPEDQHKGPRGTPHAVHRGRRRAINTTHHVSSRYNNTPQGTHTLQGDKQLPA
jgi:hypothetical protein